MKNLLKSTPIYALVCTAALATLPTHVANAAEVVVYSARSEPLIKPLFDAYTQATGVKVKFITDAEGPLLARLKAEGKNTPADVLLTVDAGNLWQATDLGLLKPVQSKVLQTNIPAHLRDPNNAWFGMSVRARTIVYNTQKVKPSELSSYEDLASSTWKNRLCLRTSKKVYNQSLVAMLMSEHGTAKAEAIVKGWVNNLATPPIADDTKAIESVAAGLCDVTIVNTYYFGRLKQQSPQLPVAIFWPNQAPGVSNSGVHVNISGAGVTTHAPHPAEAVKLVEWLSSEKAQSMYADINMEYPANPRVKPAAIVASWGTFKQSPMNVNEAGKRQSLAVMLMDRVGYK